MDFSVNFLVISRKYKFSAIIPALSLFGVHTNVRIRIKIWGFDFDFDFDPNVDFDFDPNVDSDWVVTMG